MMKKTIFLLVALSLALFLVVGCGDESVADEPAADEDVDVEVPEDEVITFRVAGQSPVDNPDTQALYEIAEQVEAESNGRLQMRIYPASQLGDYTAVHEEIMRGTIEMGLISTSPEHDDRLLIGYMPYIAEDYEKVRELFQPGSFIYNTYADIHNDLNTEFLGFWAEGLGVLGATEMPNDPANPDADKGIMIRVPPIDGVRLSVTEQGYRTTSIAYSDLYSALETGVADGWVGGSELLNYTGFRDVIDYIVVINNFFEATFFLANQDFWNSLSPEDQAIIRDAVEDKSIMSLELVEEINLEYRELLREEGVEVIELSQDEISNIAEQVRERAWPQLEEMIGSDIVQGLMEQY